MSCLLIFLMVSVLFSAYDCEYYNKGITYTAFISLFTTMLTCLIRIFVFSASVQFWAKARTDSSPSETGPRFWPPGSLLVLFPLVPLVLLVPLDLLGRCSCTEPTAVRTRAFCRTSWWPQASAERDPMVSTDIEHNMCMHNSSVERHWAECHCARCEWAFMFICSETLEIPQC